MLKSISFEILMKRKTFIARAAGGTRTAIVGHGQSNLKREADDSIPRKINERLIRNDRIPPDANRNGSAGPGN